MKRLGGERRTAKPEPHYDICTDQIIDTAEAVYRLKHGMYWKVPLDGRHERLLPENIPGKSPGEWRYEIGMNSDLAFCLEFPGEPIYEFWDYELPYYGEVNPLMSEDQMAENVGVEWLDWRRWLWNNPFQVANEATRLGLREYAWASADMCLEFIYSKHSRGWQYPRLLPRGMTMDVVVDSWLLAWGHNPHPGIWVPKQIEVDA